MKSSASGDGAHGVQTAAYNLPNDDKVIAAKRQQARDAEKCSGSKVSQCADADRTADSHKAAMVDVSFELFFTHILAHELMHGLGPHEIKVQDRDTNPRWN